MLGIPGALLAVPVLASLSVIIDEVQRERLARHGEDLAAGDQGVAGAGSSAAASAIEAHSKTR